MSEKWLQSLIALLPDLSSSSPSLPSALTSLYQTLLDGFYHQYLPIYHPHIQHLFTLTLHSLFFILSPKYIYKQIVTTIALQSLVVLLHRLKSLIDYLHSLLSSYGQKIFLLKLKLKLTNEYYEWRRIATDLDEVMNEIDWIEEDQSRLYDYKILQKRIQQIERMEYSRDKFGLMFRLRGALAREQYGLLHEGLYSRAYSGTKRLIQVYNQTISSALNYISDYNEDDIEVGTLNTPPDHSLS
jgi:TAG lipase / steryl ester hydrolase / phospholipase A2 / LPA acyltransferase